MLRTLLSRNVLLTLLAGAAGVGLTRVVYIPGGAFTGAMLVTAVVRLLGAPLAEPPRQVRLGARIVLGLMVGASVTPDTLGAVARAIGPVVLTVLAMIALSLATAWAINRLARMPLPTALCGSAPGALAAMVALAEDLGGEAPVVACMHLVRLVSVLLFVPAFVTATIAAGVAQAPVAAAAVAAPDGLVWRLALLLAAGFVVGFLAVRYRVPAGELLGGMAVAAILNPLILGLPALPAFWRLFAQWIVGAGVGATVTRETLRHFRPFALAGGVMTVLLIAAGLGMAWLLALATPIDLVTAVVGCAPGGADTMIILAGELGADAQLVTAMHVSRLIIIMLLLPFITRWICGRRPRATAGVAEECDEETRVAATAPAPPVEVPSARRGR